MSKQHGAREQTKLAKQRAKRDNRRRQLARRNSPDPTIRLKSVDHWPIVAALVPENLWTIGIGQLIITRRMPDGRFACAIFLVDVFCLGVKDADWKVVGPSEFQSLRNQMEQVHPLREVTPEYFAKLVNRAVDYGQSLGFAPHRDFRHAQRLMAGIDPSQCPDEFEFGQDGRPLYIRGPFESLERARFIAGRVAALGGHYTIPLKPSELSPEFELVGDELDEYEVGALEANDEHDDKPRRRSWLPWRQGSC